MILMVDVMKEKKLMAKYKIGVIVGSLRRDSFNLKLANAVTNLFPADFAVEHIDIGQLPLYNQDDDANPVAVVRKFKEEIKSVDALLFVTPEYNRSIPGVLKNALDQASRPYGQSAWQGKPAGILGISVGAIGTAMAQQHLRNILAYLDMPTMGQPEAFLQAKDGLFDADGNIGATSKEFVQTWVNRYADWVKTHIKN